MSTLLLKKRQAKLAERMDDPHCSLELLQRTYHQFSVLNRLISGWWRVYQRLLKPHLSASSSLLDIGCGGGDIVRRLALWAARDGLKLEITAIDPDPRALEFARAQRAPAVRFLQASSRDLVKAGERFDLVISNHLLHHLSDAALQQCCLDSEQLTKKLAVHNDIQRHDLAYLAYLPSRFFFLRSFIFIDGLRSIRRSFTLEELRSLAPENWRLETLMPFRNLLIYEP